MVEKKKLEIVGNGTRTDTAVVRTLGTGITAFGPREGTVVNAEESVLLLKTKPWDGILCQIHDLLGVVTEVGPVGGAIVVVGFCQDEDVVTATERVFEDGSGTQVDI